MPLTFSHPALILPAKYLPERWVSMTGLIVGSVTPDFEYFIRMKVESEFSHTWIGMFWFDLPLALLLTFIYHYIVRNALICNLPVFLKKRLSRYLDFNWINYFKHNYFKVIICLLISITTHLFWDSFTHPHGSFVKIIPLLRQNVSLFGFHIPVYNLLQHISSLGGAVVVIYAIMRIPREVKYAKSHAPGYYWLIVIGTGVVVANIRLLTGLYYGEYNNIAISAISGMLLGSIIAPLFLERNIIKIN